MKFKAIFFAGALFGAGSLYAAAICPLTSSNNVGADPTGCGVLITMTSATAGTVTITGTGPYDGSDDTTVGVINNSTGPISSLSLTATNGAFGFEGDGIQTFTATNGVKIGTGGATTYEGPDSTFNLAGVDGGACSGTPVSCSPGNGTLVVDFATAIGVGGSDYFSLEGAPSVGSGIGVGGGAVPEPSTFGALAAGLLGLAGLVRYRRTKG